MMDHRLALARRELGKSVVAINPHIESVLEQGKPNMCYGVKDTTQIPSYIFNRLNQYPELAWLTIDRAADNGRAIDPDLTNPLTYRRMTGSTSGGPINILKGINDFAIGTDGGGSVLAPAMSCQLPSIIGAGLGLYVNNEKKSTDGKIFTGSVGVIGKSITKISDIIEILIDEPLVPVENEKLNIVIPKKGSITCPDQKDMNEKVMGYLSNITNDHHEILEKEMNGIDDREKAINVIEEVFAEQKADVIITYEGPVDVYGYGETIPRQFGPVGEDLTNNHGKYLMRAANMCHTTAITMPTHDLASGLVIISKKGINNSKKAIKLALELEKVISLPEVWKRYFLDEQRHDTLTFQSDEKEEL